MLVEKRQKITISATVSWQKLVSELTIEQDGNLTVFIDNQDTEAVYFDNLELRVESDPTLVITQEHHYYPFGMNMSGIERDGELKYQFNGMVEKEEAFGLELYETPFRSYDAQLGRFWQVEPLADEFHSISMFQFAFNNPVSMNDPTGLIPNGGHLKKEPEYTYSFDQGSWLNSSGAQVSTGEAMDWVNGSFLWDNRNEVLTLSGDIMTKALNLMGEGEITNFAISEGNGRGEVARITYNHKASNGQESLVGISLETNDGGGLIPWKPIRDGIIKVIEKDLKVIDYGWNHWTFGTEIEKQESGHKGAINLDLAGMYHGRLAIKRDVITTRTLVGSANGEMLSSGKFRITGGGVRYNGFGGFVFSETDFFTGAENFRITLNLYGFTGELLLKPDDAILSFGKTWLEAGGSVWHTGGKTRTGTAFALLKASDFIE
ncbi:RHS repeat-associated core domain protein [Bernardetia litoralis DSM 6794]|uniref:RHS repeat-associated core domain protein n=1 Tax=Bernardetia litoralis (strain ATCC 23117 / DSM 6794 / NBRC 15988 / NCIMB 1366 / Fx l1 / Sio-4) TaxID=880071 RepID=I4AFF5_BERLS|nr:RHS repeat-associated core domain-containing protein [Bernardetia litoralis]AFM02690.1 RHS repeat-associated core domain protein [Bernardetia litoralis DSM 6794]